MGMISIVCYCFAKIGKNVLIENILVNYSQKAIKNSIFAS